MHFSSCSQSLKKKEKNINNNPNNPAELNLGDYSRSEDRHLPAAEVPDVKPDILIVESMFLYFLFTSYHVLPAP